MRAPIRISLKAGEKIFVNGAVIQVDRKTSLAFLNDVAFLLEDHVMQPEHISSPLQQVYFTLQMMLIEPETRAASLSDYDDLHGALTKSIRNPDILKGLAIARIEVQRRRVFEAMKVIRSLFDLEARIMKQSSVDGIADVA